jgi:hypothetical protein
LVARTRRERPTARIVYRDAEGKPVDNPAAAVGGEVVEHSDEGRPGKRFWFRMVELELPGLRISEAAFLLWVLALLLLIWLLIAVFLLLL